jgi:hypothetical protein
MLVPFITEIKRRIERRRKSSSEGPSKWRFSVRVATAVAILAMFGVAGYVSATTANEVSESDDAVVTVEFKSDSGAHFENVKMISGPSSVETINRLSHDDCAVVSKDTSYLNDFLSRYDYTVVATAEQDGVSVAFWCDSSSTGTRAESKQAALEDEYSALLIKIDEKVHYKQDVVLKSVQKKFEAWWADLSAKGFEHILRDIFGSESAKMQFLKEFKTTQDVSKCTDDLAFSFALEQFVNGRSIRSERGSATQFSEICQTKLNADVDKQRSPLTAAFIRVKNAEAILAE